MLKDYIGNCFVVSLILLTIVGFYQNTTFQFFIFNFLISPSTPLTNLTKGDSGWNPTTNDGKSEKYFVGLPTTKYGERGNDFAASPLQNLA